jgi:hypothetical protein
LPISAQHPLLTSKIGRLENVVQHAVGPNIFFILYNSAFSRENAADLYATACFVQPSRI